MQRPVILRPATLSDAPGIARVHFRAWRAAYENLAPQEAWDLLDEPLRLRRWTAQLSGLGDHEAVLVAEMDDRVVGVGCASAPSQPLFGDRGEIRHLYLEPDLRGQGLGRRFMGALAGQLDAWGYDSAALGVVAGNASAIGFYRALGAREAGRYEDPGPVWRSSNLVLVWDDLGALTPRC